MKLRFLLLPLSLVACKASEPTPAPQTTTTHAASTPAFTRPSEPAKTVFAWNDQVTLSGTVVEKEVMSSRGGSLKTQFLVLDTPISVRDEAGKPVLGTYENEKELWYAGKSDAKALVGKRVTYSGGLEPMQTGHHHSNVWLTGDLTPAQ